MARRAVKPEPFRFVSVGADIVETPNLTPLAIRQIRGAEREGRVRCPTCKGRMTLLIDDDGSAVAVHRAPNPYAGHEPEDFELRKTKRLAAGRLRQIFPSAPLELDVHMPEIDHLADIVVLTGLGGRIAVEVQKADLAADQAAELRARYEHIGVRCLWLLDGRRLRTTRTPAPEQRIVKTMIDTLETSLLAIGEPLMYVDCDGRQITWVRPHPAVRELASLGDKRVGRVESLVRSYPIGQLRVKQGRWWLPTEYHAKPPKPPALPQNLAKRLDRLRAASAR